MRRPGTVPSRRWWRRLENRAIAAHNRDQLSALQRLAHQEVDCVVRADAPAGIVAFRLPQHRLLLADVIPAERRILLAMQAAGPLRLTAGGRYGRLWWLTISNGQADTVVAGSRARLIADAGGSLVGGPRAVGITPLRG